MLVGVTGKLTCLNTRKFQSLTQMELQAIMKESSNYADLSVIVKVFAEVEDLVDFVRCAAVCKAWQAACQQVHPTSLHVMPDMYDKKIVFNPDGLVGVVKWLQLKNRAGCFDDLQRVVVTIYGDEDCTSDCHQHHRLQLFSQSVAALAGCWHLRRLLLILHSPIAMAAPMLPPSLRHLVLQLHTDTLPGIVALSMFEGLKELQKLDIVLFNKGDQAIIAKRQKTASFKVDAHFSALTSLRLSPWPISMPVGNALSDCMPKLQILNVVLTPPLAQSVVDLATLHTLTLNIVCFHLVHEHCHVHVGALCHLRFLKVLSSTVNKITLHVSNANVQYHTEGIHAVTNPFALPLDLDDDRFFGYLSD